MPGNPFTVGNIVVYRVGTADGLSLGQDAVPVFLDEYTPAGILVQSIALPTADDGAHQTLTARGVASGVQASEGHLNLSVDGRYLVLTGYDAAPGTQGVVSTSTNIGASPIVRVIGRVSAQGEVDTTTTTLGFNGSQIRGVASVDGSSFWLVGANSGVVYTEYGATDAGDLVSNGATNIRSVEIFQGQLFIGTGSSSVRLGRVGLDLPFTPNNTPTTLPGIPNSILANQFVLLDLDGIVGVDTLYVADESAGIRKFSFDGSSWIARGVAGSGFFGLEGAESDGDVVLYATTASTNGNVLTAFVDTAAYNETIAGTFTPIAVAPGNSGFRGVAFAPIGFQLGIGFAASEYSVVEGDAGTSLVTVVVQRLFNGIDAIYFSGTIALGDTDDADFVGGATTSFLGVIDAGQATGTFSIEVQGDPNVELIRERFTLTLTSATAAGGGTVQIPTATQSATGVIVDDDGFEAFFNVGTMTLADGFRVTGAADGDGAGTAVAGPGDIDGDGLDDILAGAPYFDVAEAANAGAVYVLGGKPGTRADLDLGALDEADGLDVRAAFADQNLGLGVGPGFDSNYYGPNDGAGANSTWTISGGYGLYSPIGGNRPSAWVLEGDRIVRESYVLRLDELFPTTTFRLLGSDDPDFTDPTLSKNRTGDVNGDGLRDMVIGFPGADGSLTPGRTFVVFWNGRDLAGDVVLPQDPGDSTMKVVEITGDAPGDRAGQSVDTADVNGDGKADVLLGAPGSDDAGEGAGEVHVIFSPVADVDVTGLESRPSEGFTILGEDAGDHAGYSVSFGGDFNGDGIDDVLIGAPGDDDGGAEAGAAYVVFGQAGTVVTIDLGNLGASGFKIVGEAAGHEAGRAVSNAGDVNGDGYDDILVGAPGAFDAGRAYLVCGRPTAPGTIDLANLAGHGFRVEAANPLDNFGYSLSSAGDVNGDGYDDFLVGAPTALTAAGRTGAFYLIYGTATTPSSANSIADDVLGGTAGGDLIDASLGGADSVNGGAGDDGFFFGAAFTPADRVDGGNGSNDQLGLEGDYAGANALTLAPRSIEDVEVIAVLPGFDYDITTVDANVRAGRLLTVFGGNLAVDDAFTFDGSAESNGAFKVYGGEGTDRVTTGAGDDGVFFGPNKFVPLVDRIVGGAGDNDQLALSGDYSVVLDGTAIVGIETVALLPGAAGEPADYALLLDDTLIADDGAMTFWGATLLTALLLDGRAEAGGTIRIFGGTVDDSLTGGGGGDWFWGGPGQDAMAGGGGTDTFRYNAAAESLRSAFDTLTGFDDDADTIDLPFAVAGFVPGVEGSIDPSTMLATLETAFAALAAHQAGVFATPGGTSYLVIDANGTAGYQADSDYLIAFAAPVSPIDNVAMFN